MSDARYGEIVCAVCGWWPPLVGVRRGRTYPLEERQRWQRLRRHVGLLAFTEWSDRADVDGPGPHEALLAQLEAHDARA